MEETQLKVQELQHLKLNQKKINIMAEQPSLTTAQQMYETERLAAENKRLKRTIDERLNELKAIRQRNENLTESFQENLYLKVLLGMVCLSVLLCIALISFLLHL